ncbi:ARM repeat-containing protein [Gautieria morchelliformis]|nr:ARM repeat-containing protein [Gautieria morchelliformis]
MSETNAFEIDEAKVSDENGEIYVFQWLCSLERAIERVPMDALRNAQSSVEATLLSIAKGADPYPIPGRPIRHLVARCFIAIYTRGETRTLFDTLQALVKVAGEMKPLDRDTRVAAFSCIGDLMAVFGSQVMSFMAEIALVSLKTLKNNSNPVLLRFHAITALQKSLSTAARAVTDSLSKDIIKQMKSALSDKALSIQRAAADVLVIMYPANDGNRTVADVESVVTLCTKSLDGADQLTRHSLARLAGHILASTQVQKAPPPPDASKKGGNKKDQDGDEQDESPIPPPSNGAPTTILPVENMLLQLSSQFNKTTSTRKMRIGIISFYATLFTTLGSAFVESNYPLIVRNLMYEVVQTPRSSLTRYEKLLVRKLVEVLLRDLIGTRMLSEPGQIGAIRELSNSYLKKWPALMPGQISPSPLTLVVVLKEIAGLLQQLGNAPPPVQDALSAPLVDLLAHPNHSTRISAAWTLRCFCRSTPLRLPKIVLTVMEMLQRDISTLSTPAAPANIDQRALGHAYGLSALFTVIPERPLYVSYDISAKVLDMAIQLLKRAGDHDVKVAGIEVEVAWTCIASIMTLGPNFVRSHLPQLLVLWRNALPKPTSKDTTTNIARSPQEWMFLLHVRECALGAILSFLRHNSPVLITLDVARRIASLLSNALLFANAFVAQKVDEQQDGAISFGGSRYIDLPTREALLRRRVYECFGALGFSTLTESMQSTLLQSVVSQFASPDGYTGSSVQAAIATSSGTFTSVWHSADGYGSGVTSIDVVTQPLSSEADAHVQSEKKNTLNRDTIETSIDILIAKPVIGSCEHDPLVVCQSRATEVAHIWPEPPPPVTSVTDTAIELFAALLPIQDSQSSARVIAQVIESVRSSRLERNTGRKAAVFVNATIAVLLALRSATTSHFRHARDTLGNTQVTTGLADFLMGAILDGDIVLRTAGSEALGRLASLAGTPFLASQTKTLVDQVVSNRDPNGRAGCALAFGAIYSHVGGMAAGPLLKTTVNLLMSLGNDPHPVVHFWALSALSQVIIAASLAYSPFVSSTLGMLFKLYTLDTHEIEGGTLTNSNISGDLPTYQVVCQIIDAVIGVLGPELQDSATTRTLVLDLVEEFGHESEEGICVEAIKCIQHFLIFTPEQVEIRDLVRKLRAHLSSSRRPLKMASINALYQMVQRDALTMSKIGGDRLVEDLFGMLDDASASEGVRGIISSWLRQTVIHNPSAWIDLCQRIMARTTASQQATNAAAQAGSGMQDDEAESFAGVGDPIPQGGHLTSRWQTQLFALQCIHDICTVVVRSNRREHLDIPFARQQNLQESNLLVSRVPDLIKMAFTASAAYVTEIRVEGLTVLRDVIEVFAKSPDPDYEDALLLEQHQAPITAALTPAFSSDSTPEILASAVEVCAVFVGCGVVRDVSKMGRILKLLTSALEQSTASGMLSIGDVGELSPNASVMLRISTLTAWAELETATIHQPYLLHVVSPHRATLASLWIATLRDYASVRADSEAVQESTSAGLDSSYFGLGREALLPYYDQSWFKILKAVATAMQSNDPYILAAMDGKASTSASNAPLSLRNEPTAFFFVVFGLVYDALATSSADSTSTGASRETAVTALKALKSLVRPEYSGNAILDSVIFGEFSGLCYRMAMTETAAVQIHLVEAIAALANSQSSSLTPREEADNKSFPPDSPLTHCLRICAYVLRHALPSARTSIAIVEGNMFADRIRLLVTAFKAFSIIGSTFGPRLQEDIRAVSVSLYAELLKDEHSELDIAGPTLPALKAMLAPPSEAKLCRSDSKYGRLVHGLISACLLHIDEMSGRVGPASTNKVKNNLLAAVLILTVVPPSLALSQAVVEHCCFLISQKLLEPLELCLTAAHCAKTIFTAASAGSQLLQQCIKLLVPGMITYVASVAALVDEPEAQRIHGPAIEEILKAFSTFLWAVPEISRPALLCILLPTLALLLDPSRSPSPPIHMQAVTHLLGFATGAPAAFKEAAGKLEQDVRDTLEASIRQAVGASKTSTQAAASKPQISLRSF